MVFNYNQQQQNIQQISGTDSLIELINHRSDPDESKGEATYFVSEQMLKELKRAGSEQADSGVVSLMRHPALLKRLAYSIFVASTAERHRLNLETHVCQLFERSPQELMIWHNLTNGGLQRALSL